LKQIKNIIVLGLWLSFLLSGVATHAQAGGNPSCHFTPYTADYIGQHYSLVKNNSTLIGSTMVIESNCPFTYSFNDVVFSSSETISFEIPLSTSELKITQENITHIYSDLTIYPSSSIFYGDYEDPSLLSQKSNEEVWWGEILAHATTFIILYFLSTTIVYRFAKKRVDDSIEVII